MRPPDSLETALTRRALLRSGLGAGALLAHAVAARAAPRRASINGATAFRARALAKGISEATWNRAMGRIEPDMSVFKEIREPARIHTSRSGNTSTAASPTGASSTARSALKKNEALFARIEKDFGVERGTLLALWGVEFAFGDPLVQQNHMRPVFPSLAALAWNEPRRKRLLGKRADQRAAHRRSRLEHAGGDARLLGRRDGPHPMDAGSLAQCRHRL